MSDDDLTDEERAYCEEHDLDVRRIDGVLCAEWDGRWVPFDLREDPPVPKRQTLISASVEPGGFMGDEATYELGKIDDTTLVSISYMDGAGTTVSVWDFEAGTEEDQIQGFIDDMRELEPDAVDADQLDDENEGDEDDEALDDVRTISFYREWRQGVALSAAPTGPSTGTLVTMSNPAQVVADFIAAVEAKDVDTAVALLTDDVSYENVPLDPIAGKDAVRDTLLLFLDSASEVDWQVHRQLVDGHVVVNERLDRFRIRDGWLELPVAGVFEVTDDGLIRLWRDYFDMASYTAQLAALTGG